jgi:hypothetical protein
MVDSGVWISRVSLLRYDSFGAIAVLCFAPRATGG